MTDPNLSTMRTRINGLVLTLAEKTWASNQLTANPDLATTWTPETDVDLTAFIKVSAAPIQTAPAGDQLLKDIKESTDKNHELLLKLFSDKLSIKFSDITADKLNKALHDFIKIMPGSIPQDKGRVLKSAKAFEWTDHEDKLTNKVLAWFKKMAPSVYAWDDVSNGEVIRVDLNGYTFRGKTDLRLSHTQDWRDAVLIVQLKRNILTPSGVDTSAQAQCQVEMLAAGSVSAYSVVGVLTDTTNWVFYWMSDMKTMRYTKRSTTFDGLNVLRCIIENLPDLNDEIYDPNGFGGKQPEFMEYPQRVYKFSVPSNNADVSSVLDLLPFMRIEDQMDTLRDHYSHQLSYFN